MGGGPRNPVPDGLLTCLPAEFLVFLGAFTLAFGLRFKHYGPKANEARPWPSLPSPTFWPNILSPQFLGLLQFLTSGFLFGTTGPLVLWYYDPRELRLSHGPLAKGQIAGCGNKEEYKK